MPKPAHHVVDYSAVTADLLARINNMEEQQKRACDYCILG